MFCQIFTLNMIFIEKKFLSGGKKDIELTFIGGMMFISLFVGGAIGCWINSISTTPTTIYQVEIIDKDGNSIYSDTLKNDMQPAINFFESNSEDGSKMIITRETIQN